MTKKKANPKPAGRPCAYSGVKLEFLEEYADEWIADVDRNGLYTRISKKFFLRFGYTLNITENPTTDDVPDPDIDPSLSLEERLTESTRRSEMYKTFRKVSPLLIEGRVSEADLLNRN